METTSLTAEERRAVEVLCEDWRDLLRCTAIHQAMERVALPFSHASRLRIAEFLIGDATASGLMRWAPSIYVLRNGEKLIARQVLRLVREGVPMPPPQGDEWRKLGLNAKEIEDAFDAMTWLGFMRKTDGRYDLAEGCESFLRGLGFYFHEVVLPARRERFNTNCAPDFFIMTCSPVRERMCERLSQGAGSAPREGMSEKMLDAVRDPNASGARPLTDSAFYGSERAILNDACGWSDQPIRIVMDHGKLVEIKPETTWYLLGGG
jgi:hypothetical protein